MARRKNVKRIDPRYFLHETVNRGEELEEKRGYFDPPDPSDPGWPWAPGDTEEGNRSHSGEAVPVLGTPRRRPGETREEYEQRLMKGKHRMMSRVADPGEGDPYELEEGCPPEGHEGGEELDISGPGTEVHVDDISQLSPEEAFAAGMAAARDAIDQVMGGPDGPPPEGGFSGNGPMGEPAMHEAAIEESYATTGIEPVHGVLWGKEEVQTPHGTVEVVPITDAGQRPSYARPPVTDKRAQQAIKQFTILKDKVKEMAAAGKFDGYSQIYVHPLPNRAGDLMLYTVDGKREHRPLSEF